MDVLHSERSGVTATEKREREKSEREENGFGNGMV